MGFCHTGTVLPWSGFTVQVNTSLKRPIETGSVLMLRATVDKVEGRKVRSVLWVTTVTCQYFDCCRSGSTASSLILQVAQFTAAVVGYICRIRIAEWAAAAAAAKTTLSIIHTSLNQGKTRPAAPFNARRHAMSPARIGCRCGV